jgi:hypothetical protein
LKSSHTDLSILTDAAINSIIAGQNPTNQLQNGVKLF